MAARSGPIGQARGASCSLALFTDSLIAGGQLVGRLVGGETRGSDCTDGGGCLDIETYCLTGFLSSLNKSWKSDVGEIMSKKLLALPPSLSVSQVIL